MANSAARVDETTVTAVHQVVLFNLLHFYESDNRFDQGQLEALVTSYITLETFANSRGAYVATALIAVGRILERLGGNLEDIAVASLAESLTRILGE